MMRTSVLATAIALSLLSGSVLAQSPAPSTESALLAQGWTLLSQGDAAKAASVAAQALAQNPLSTAALTLAVDADIVRTGGGAMAALGTYENWLSTRRLDDGYVLRRVARAALREASNDTQQPDTRLEALRALADDGDRDALQQLTAERNKGGFGETQTLAAMGDPGAVQILISEMNSAPPGSNKQRFIGSLGESHSKDAIAPLKAMLGDSFMPNRAEAAMALGKLGATETIPALQKMLADKDEPFFVRFATASALAWLDDGAGITYLRNVMASDATLEPNGGTNLKVQAAEALASHPDQTWQNDVRALAQDPDPQVRVTAARLLSPYDNAGAKAMLDRLLLDGNIAIQELAAKTLAKDVASDFATLRGLLRRSSGLGRVRAANRILELTR